MEQMQQTPYRKFSPLLDLGLWSRLQCIVVALCSWRREGKLALGSHVATLLLSLIRFCDAIMNPFLVRVDGLFRYLSLFDAFDVFFFLMFLWCFFLFFIVEFRSNGAVFLNTCCSCVCFECFWTIFDKKNAFLGFFLLNWRNKFLLIQVLFNILADTKYKYKNIKKNP